MKSENSSLKNILLIILFVILFVILGGIIFLIFNNSKFFISVENIYLVSVRGYNLDKDFSLDTYEYNLEVSENVVEVSCDADKEIEGCNVSLDLTGKDVYVHKIKVYDGKKTNVYTFNIKNNSHSVSKNFNIKSVDGNTLKWTNKDIQLEITLFDDGVYSYSFDGGNTWQESNKLVVSENGEFQVVVKNQDGELSNIKKVEVDKIDKEAPQGVINKFNVTSSKITLEIVTYDDMSGVDSVSFNGEEFSSSVKYEVTKSGKYFIQVKDKAGNVSEKKYIEIFESDFNSDVKKKSYTLTLKGNGAIVSKDKLTCTTTADSCEVVLPRIITDYIPIGWADSSDSNTAIYTEGQTIKLNKNMTLYAITKKVYTAIFNKNGASNIGQSQVSCMTYNNGSCSVTAPSITTSGVVIGWSKSSNAKTSEVSVNQKIELTGNVNYYAITKRTYTATFNKNGTSSIGSSSLSCTSYNNGSCSVTAPSISTTGQVIGWSKSSSAKTSEVSVNQKIELTGNVNYYAITKRTYTATFNKNGASSIGSSSLSCTSYNNGSCSVTAPSISTTGQVIGWSKSSNAKTSEVSVNQKIELTGNVNYYAITKRTYTATFDGRGLDYLATSSLSCSVYNTGSSCNIILPAFNKSGYFNSFWSPYQIASSSLSSSGTTWSWKYFNQVGHSYTLTDNVVMYPNFNHFHYDLSDSTHKYRTINMSYSKFIGKSLFEFESGIPQGAINNFIGTMESVYELFPWLFISGKAFVMTESTYTKHSIAYALTHQMYVNYGGDSHFNIDLKYDSSGAVVKNAIDINGALHEMAHAWDSYYYYKTGNARISSLSDFDSFYNSIYDKLSITNGDKISKVETFAGMFTNYYWHVLGKDTSKEYYALKSGAKLNSSELNRLKTFMEKYINISKNGY